MERWYNATRFPSSSLLCKKNMVFFLTETVWFTMGNAIEEKIVSRIYGSGRGWAFSQADFADLGSRAAIDLALHRREKESLVLAFLRATHHYPTFTSAL